MKTAGKNRIKYKIIIFMIFMISICDISAQLNNNAVINWQKGYITSKSSVAFTVLDRGIPADSHTGEIISINTARIRAGLEAKSEAIENLAMTLKSIQVDPDKKLEDLINEESFTQKRLPEKLMDSLVTKEYPLDFYTSACEVKLYFIDIINSIPCNLPGNDFPIIDNPAIPTYYSSLIIDTRGLDVRPMIFPSVYIENGKEIYGKQFINGAYMQSGGMISYCHTEDEAFKNTRAGDVPFFTVAIKRIKNCPMITKKAARKILSHPGTVKNLKSCRVIFIIDREG